MIIAVLTSLIAGFLNSISGLFQRKGIGSPEPENLYSKQQIAKTTKNKLWQIGAIAEGGAALLELVALYYGSLLLVEPLLMTNLVFLLILVHFKLKRRVLLREWIGIAAISIGISLFLIIANPHGGQPTYGTMWLAPILIITFLMGAGAMATRRLSSSKIRGSMGAFVGGLSLGLTAALTRLAMVELHRGVIVTLTQWPLYALIVSSVISVLAIQVGYGSGPLTITQSILEITSPIVSILLGIIMFGDFINTSPLAIIVEIISFSVAIAGVIVISASKRNISIETSAILPWTTR